MKKKYTCFQALNNLGEYYISLSKNAPVFSAIKFENSNDLISFESKEEADFFCQILESEKYIHQCKENCLIFFDETTLPIVAIKQEYMALRLLQYIPPSWSSFPKAADLLLRLRLNVMLKFIKDENVESINDDRFENLAESKNLTSENFSLQGLTLNEWLSQLTDFEECERWICGIFGFHHICEVILCMSEQSKIFQSFMFGTYEPDKNFKKTQKKVFKEQYPKWMNTEIGKRWHEFSVLVPDQIHYAVAALAPISKSNMVSLFCLVTKKTPDAFAKLVTRLSDLASVDKKNSYADAYEAYKEIQNYLNVFATRDENFFKINPKKYLNASGQSEYWIDPNCLRVQAINDDSFSIEHFEHNKVTPISSGVGEPLIFNNELLANEIVTDLRRAKTLVLKDNGGLTLDSFMSFYKLETICQDFRGSYFEASSLPVLAEPDPELFLTLLMSELYSDKTNSKSEYLSKFLEHHKSRESEIHEAIDWFKNVSSDDDQKVETFILLSQIIAEEFGEWLEPFYAWRLQNEFSETGRWPGFYIYKEVSQATVSLLMNSWSDETDLSAAINEVKGTICGRNWYSYLEKLSPSVRAAAQTMFAQTNISPEFFLFCLTEDKSVAFVKNYFTKISETNYLRLPNDTNLDELVESYEICREFVRLKNKIDGSVRANEFLSRDESITLEYKSSFQTPFPKIFGEVNDKGQTVFKLNKIEFTSEKKVREHLQFQCLKAVAGFLNSRGGSLIVGISEKDGKNSVIGIESEWRYEDDDKYERMFIQEIVNHFGKAVAGDYITTEIHRIQNKKIMEVKVQAIKRVQGATPVFLRDKLYKRTGPRTDELTGAEIANFTVEFQKQDLSSFENSDFLKLFRN